MPEAKSKSRDIQFLHHRDFDQSVFALRKAGGDRKRKADKVLQILGSLQTGLGSLKDLPTTKSGEGRVKHCTKYDLGGGYRLVTVQTENVVAFCFAGTHEEVDRWLESHTGFTLGRNAAGSWEPIYKSSSFDDPIRREPAPSAEKLFDRIDQDRLDRLLEGLPARTVRMLLSLGPLVSPIQLEECCATIPSESRRVLVYDVLCLLGSGSRHAAESRLDLDLGRAATVEELPAEEVLEIRDGDTMRRLRIGSPEHAQWLTAFSRTAEPMEWLLFLHPEQAAVVNADFTGPAQLSGVSGSGKTCVAIHRALRLARSRPGARVLLVTLNRALAGLIQRLVDAAAPDEIVRESISVLSFFELCQQLLFELEPQGQKRYRDVTWKLGEHIDEIFREYYRCWVNNDGAACLLPLHHSLISQGLCAETYVREEFDWIRSAVTVTARDRYLDLERLGRRIPLQEDARAKVLEGLSNWEAKMEDVGVIDYLGLTTAISAHIRSLTPRYDHVIVDEAQDFGTSELTVLRALCVPSENDLFLCGDIAQHVLPKHRSMSDAGIQTTGRSRRIVRNYRNSREILKAAYEVLIANLDEGMLDSSDLEILDPEYASRSSNEPAVLEADSIEEEIGFARTLAGEHVLMNPAHRCCIAFAGHTIREVEAFAAKRGLHVLRGEKGPVDEPIVFSDLEQMKGYEFNLVIIVGCRQGVLPPDGAAEKEYFRHGCKLYVAMTRARDDLYLSYSGTPTSWLDRSSKFLSFMRWEAVISLDKSLMTAPPEPLREAESETAGSIFKLNGRAFLYTPYARGLSLEAIRKVDELVDGVGLIRNRERVRWRDIGTLYDDLNSKQARARQLLGPVVHEEIRVKLAAAT